MLPVSGHIVFTTVAGQGWLAGPKPSLDSSRPIASGTSAIKRDAGPRRVAEELPRSLVHNFVLPRVRAGFRRRRPPGRSS